MDVIDVDKPSNDMSETINLDEEDSITGGKSVSEIVQLLRTKTKIKGNKGFDDDGIRNDYKGNKAWMSKLIVECREVIQNPSIQGLDNIVTKFLENVEEEVKKCYKGPKRAFKMGQEINTFLMIFHLIYWEMKKPLEDTSYLDKMSDILASYIDLEIKSSRRGKESPKTTSQRICSALYLYLDKSIDHMLDAVLKSKFFIKKYKEICCPIIARLLKDSPGQMLETTYVRYILSYKLWKKLAAKEDIGNINKRAVSMLKPPPDFAETLKSGIFSSVLPYVSKSEKERITLFLMKSPFNVKKKAQVFLKDGKKIQASGDLDKAFDEDITMSSLFEEDDESGDLLNDIWIKLDKEPSSIDDLFENDTIENKEEVLSIKNVVKLKEKTKKVSKDHLNNNVTKLSVKKRKNLKDDSCLVVKKLFNKESKDMYKPDFAQLVVALITSDSIVKTEDNVDKKSLKPCATVEPEQSKDLDLNSPNKDTELLLTTSDLKKPLRCLDSEFNVIAVDDSNMEIKEKTAATDLVVSPIAAITAPTNDAVSSEGVDSSSICEEGKVEANNGESLAISQVFKEKDEDQRILEDQLVAEEVVIGTEIVQEDGCTLVFFEENGQKKLGHHDVLNVIGISKDSESIIISSDGWKNNQGKPDGKEENVSLVNNQSIPLAHVNHQKINCTKVQSSVSPENHQFLTSIVASGESNDNYVSFDRRNSYTYNDIMLTRLFSEVNADEGSDDETRFHNGQPFAKGGKISAFKEQMEDSKSDGGEEFESPSSSQTDSQRSMVEASESKSHSSVSIKNEVERQAPVVNSPQYNHSAFPLDTTQLREVTVNLYTSECENYSKGKPNLQGKQGPGRPSSSSPPKKKSARLVDKPVESHKDVPLTPPKETPPKETPSKETPPKEHVDNEYSNETDKRKRTRSVSSSLTKTNQAPQPTVVAKSQPETKKRRRRRKR